MDHVIANPMNFQCKIQYFYRLKDIKSNTQLFINLRSKLKTDKYKCSDYISLSLQNIDMYYI